jgi:16S rRNA (guanine527-N7)-methyltransferase
VRTNINTLLDIFAELKLHNETVVGDGLQKAHDLMVFLEMLLKWNRTYNLTALKTVPAVLQQHIVDSLVVIPSLNTHFQRENIPSPIILDVGTGAGLPGVVLAIMQKNFNVCCLDAVEKKIAFVSAVKGQLGLTNLITKHARVEREPSVQADVVISRAFASIVDFVRLTQVHVSNRGNLVAMKATGVEKEIVELNKRFPMWTVKSVDSLNVPGSNAARCMVWLQKEQ